MCIDIRYIGTKKCALSCMYFTSGITGYVHCTKLYIRREKMFLLRYIFIIRDDQLWEKQGIGKKGELVFKKVAQKVVFSTKKNQIFRGGGKSNMVFVVSERGYYGKMRPFKGWSQNVFVGSIISKSPPRSAQVTPFDS